MPSKTHAHTDPECIPASPTAAPCFFPALPRWFCSVCAASVSSQPRLDGQELKQSKPRVQSRDLLSLGDGWVGSAPLVTAHPMGTHSWSRESGQGCQSWGASEEKVPLTLWWGMLGSCWVMAENPKRSQQMLGEKPGSWRRCSRWVSVAKCYLRSCRWVGSSGDNCKGNKDSSFCTKGDQCQGMVRGWVLLFIGKLFELCLYTITHSKHLVLSSAPVGEGQM